MSDGTEKKVQPLVEGGGPAGIRTLDPRLSTRTVPKAYTAARDCVLILVIRTFSSSPNDKML